VIAATAPVIEGLTLEELAERRGLTRLEAASLNAPFRRAGLVVEHDGHLVVSDPLVRGALVDLPGRGHA
jgi:hypothetical protein